MPQLTPPNHNSSRQGCAVLDVIFPPYDDQVGRSCTYYSRSDAHVVQHGGCGTEEEAEGRTGARREAAKSSASSVSAGGAAGAGGDQGEGTRKRRRELGLGGCTTLVPVEPADFVVERAE